MISYWHAADDREFLRTGTVGLLEQDIVNKAVTIDYFCGQLD